MFKFLMYHFQEKNVKLFFSNLPNTEQKTKLFRKYFHIETYTLTF